jgi:ribonuclease VapC
VVLDTSAIVAIHFRESGYERLIEKMENAELLVAGTPILFETAMVLTGRLGHDARPMLAAFLREADAEVIAFSERHLDAATEAFIKYGRGRHPASLNFGDCMSYAIAAVTGLPLLFTGNDFAKTDIARA